FSDEIKLANQFRSKVYSVSMIPESAILSGGHTGNAAFWFDNQNGTFITSNYYMDSLPAWVDTFNVKKLPDTYLEKTWEMLLPQEQYKTGIKDKSKYEKGIRKQNQFPYEIEKLAKKVNRKEIYEVLNYTPYGNNLTKDFAIQVIANEELGKDDFTDVLLINFTATEYISSHYGILSFELEDMILRLDRELEHFFKFIDSFVGIENTLIYLTAENGIGYHPDYLQDNHIPSGTFSTNSSGLLLKSYLNNLYGKGDWIMDFSNGQIFLNTNLVADSDIELSELQQSIADFLIQFHGIKHTVTASTLRETHFNNGVNYKIQNGYNKKRSGHVFYTLRDGWIEVNSKKEVLKSYDATVPLLWYGWKIKRESILTPVYLDDIAPTVNILLEVNPPNAATGEPISEMFK
ncbi:MAG: alkaline phosphatase family protein, partial [Bacteroidales bacterium]|nr:alkaline phosphatase family protein [Bacteroidales bacterium]